jgi:hypothetical protein
MLSQSSINDSCMDPSLRLYCVVMLTGWAIQTVTA